MNKADITNLDALFTLMKKHNITHLTTPDGTHAVMQISPPTFPQEEESKHIAFKEPERPLDILFNGMKKGQFVE